MLNPTGFNTPTGQPYTVKECVHLVQRLNEEGHLTVGDTETLLFYLAAADAFLRGAVVQ